MKVEFLGHAAPVDNTREGLPLYLSPVQAGFPNFAEDTEDRKLDLHQYIVRHEASTFFVKATGESMIGAGIHEGDLLVVDRSLTPENNKIVIAALGGELFCKRIKLRDGMVVFASENPEFPDFDATGREDVHVWGVVTHVIHQV